MIFQAAPTLVGIVTAAAALAVVWLGWTEWRRPDRRRLSWRLGATLLAVLALALLGLRPEWHQRDVSPPEGAAAASLYTPVIRAGGAEPAPATTALRFALPGATAPADAVILPDAAALRRRFPQIGALHVYGDGLEPFDLATLRPLHLVFHPAGFPSHAPPAIGFLRCPRELPLGEPLDFSGRVVGLAPGETVALTLVSPDGTSTTATPSAARADGSTDFTMRAPAPPAAGRFDWRLRLARPGRNGGPVSDDPLGVAVVNPMLPRVLVLETTPRFDTAALRRWFERAGGKLAARTQIGKNLYRFFGPPAGSGAAPQEFTTLDAALLGGYDLVLADGRSLLALGEPERDALRAAIAENGLGVLTLVDGAVLPAAGAPIADAGKPTGGFPLPWRLLPVTGVPGDQTATPENPDRSVRVRWPGMTLPMDHPVEAAPFEIAPQALQTPLVRDDQGRAVAVTSSLGRGQLALTLVRETGRWNRANDPAAFAAYWSHLFSQVARRGVAGGRWSLAGGDAGQAKVDEPLELVWLGASAATPVLAVITDETQEAARLPLIQDASEPCRWRGVFWPRRPGWHRVSVKTVAPEQEIAPFDFYVAPPGTWVALTAERRRMVTARFAAESQTSDNISRGEVQTKGLVPVAAGWWYGLFLLGAGTLWVERRLASGRVVPTSPAASESR